MRQRDRRPNRHHSVPEKANRVLHLVFIALALLLVRIWHLAVVEHDQKMESSRRPTIRTVIEPSRRATIRDRFNLALATNRIQYNAAVNYSGIREVPTIGWETGLDGKRIKRYRRKEYIKELSKELAQHLDLDAARTEDLIHAKASFYDHSPFVIKYDITEAQYYRLKSLEREWVGLEAQRVPKRYYPLGRVAADIVGYMGAINQTEYDSFVNERKSLQAYLQAQELGEEIPLPSTVAAPYEAQRRLADLEQKAYTINDFVGKTGVEMRFEDELRGFYGKRVFHADSRGNYLRELPGGRQPLSGRRLLLTISAELQAYAEKLLIQNEAIRTPRVSKPYNPEAVVSNPKVPWIKGGAIVALDPETGEVLAMASYPRLDANDFIPSGDTGQDRTKRANIRRWFESDVYIGEIWDGKRPLLRECCTIDREVSEEEQWLTWDYYISRVLDSDSDVHRALDRTQTISQAVSLQQAIDRLQDLTADSDLGYLLNRLYEEEGHAPQICRIRGERKERMEAQLKAQPELIAEVKKALEPHMGKLKHTYDKLLLVDLCRLALCQQQISPELLAQIGHRTLADCHRTRQAVWVLSDAIREELRSVFHATFFTPWRQVNETAYLKERRAKEKEQGKHAKPYIDYLDAIEERFYASFWSTHRWDLVQAVVSDAPLDGALAAYQRHLLRWRDMLDQDHEGALANSYQWLKQLLSDLSTPLASELLRSFRSYEDLNRPLKGTYRGLRKSSGQQLERSLAAAFYPVSGYGYGRSWAYRQAAVQGSIFKLITAYTALIERYQELKGLVEDFTKLNPLEIIDQAHRDGKSWNVGYTISNKPIPQMYKGGRIPRSLSRNIGRIDLIKAIETSSNPYFGLLAVDHISEPAALARAAEQFSYGALTDIDLPGEIAGRVPDDLEENRTGLYSFAIGQHALVVTPLQTATMIATIANGGSVLQPQIIHLKAGSTPLRDETFLARGRRFPYQGALAMLGIDFPLFAATAKEPGESRVVPGMKIIRRKMPMPPGVRTPLLEGMERVATHYQTQNLDSLRQLYSRDPTAVTALANSKGQWIGKTSTGESTERISLERLTGTQTYNHVWFAGVSFDPSETPDVYLARDRFGHPELVVLVYLRFGGVGREVAPLAAQIVTKWREIKQRATGYETNSIE